VGGFQWPPLHEVYAAETLFLPGCRWLIAAGPVRGQGIVSSEFDAYTSQRWVVAPGEPIVIAGSKLVPSAATCLNPAKTAYLTTGKDRWLATRTWRAARHGSPKIR
jgi:hypothetical protein